MKKLLMLRGLPASGKSTVAREEVKRTGRAGRINRDDLRSMMFESVWTGKREEVVVACEKALARVLLDHDLLPIIDDTNLTARHENLWRDVAKDKGAQVELRDMGTLRETCISRDQARVSGRIGQAVIDRMALENRLIVWPDKPIVIFDMDGTLSDGRRREHLIQGPGPKNWEAYFSRMRFDDPVEITTNWARALSEDHTICIVSGRPDTYQSQTIWWLENYNIPFDFLFMRRNSDKRPDTQVKAEILSFMPKDRIAFAVDDRPSVIREVWRANGVKVYPARGACEEF